MIKARYGPATDDLAAQLMSNEKTGSYELDPNLRDWQVTQVIDALKKHGYDITIEVEIEGAMEQALTTLRSPETYVRSGRPQRR